MDNKREGRSRQKLDLIKHKLNKAKQKALLRQQIFQQQKIKLLKRKNITLLEIRTLEIQEKVMQINSLT